MLKRFSLSKRSNQYGKRSGKFRSNFERTVAEDLDVRNNKPEEFEREAVEGRRMFYEWIQQYDKRRGTDFLKTFPEMNKFYEDCKSCMIYFL